MSDSQDGEQDAPGLRVVPSMDMRDVLERRILDLAARLSDEDVDGARWQRTTTQFGRRFGVPTLPMSNFPIIFPGSGTGRGRSTLLRNRSGNSNCVRGNVVTEPDKIHGRRLLDIGIIASDGGEYSRDYALSNMLQENAAVYCSCKNRNVTVLLEHTESASFVLTHAVLRAPPRGSFTAPVRDALVFVSSRKPSLDDYAVYNDYTAECYRALLSRKAASGASLDEGEPAALLSTADAAADGTVTAELSVPRTGRYVVVKFLRSINSAHSTNIDVEFIGFKGFVRSRGFAEGTVR